MDILISNADSRPIYEQIYAQIKDGIVAGDLKEGELLPSIRTLAKDLHVSVITTKRAYSDLETEGFIETVQGKGCFVATGNHEMLREEQLKHVEGLLDQAVKQASELGVSRAELHEMLDLVAGEEFE